MALNYIVEKFIEQAHGGAGLKHITKKKFEETRIPLPPLPEQRRIVQKMERLSEHIDKAMTLLDQKHAFLNSLKASILDSAFKGEL
jgi:type I restriction enzyme S subunit